MSWEPPIRAFRLIAQHDLEERVRHRITVTIVMLRKAGMLDAANLVSEFLHSWENGYPSNRFPGFSDEPFGKKADRLMNRTTR